MNLALSFTNMLIKFNRNIVRATSIAGILCDCPYFVMLYSVSTRTAQTLCRIIETIRLLWNMARLSEWGLQRRNVWNRLKFFLVKKKRSGGLSWVLLKRSAEAWFWHAAVLRTESGCRVSAPASGWMLPRVIGLRAGFIRERQDFQCSSA